VEERLAREALIIDVINSPSQDKREATALFTSTVIHLALTAKDQTVAYGRN